MVAHSWKTRRLIVELPVRGDVTDTSLAWELKEAWERRPKRLGTSEYGKLRAKSFSRWASKKLPEVDVSKVKRSR